MFRSVVWRARGGFEKFTTCNTPGARLGVTLKAPGQSFFHYFGSVNL